MNLELFEKVFSTDEKINQEIIKKHMKKLKLTLIFMLLFSLECFSQQSGNGGIKSTAIRSGIGLGSVLAVVVSWERNKSVLLAFLHGIFSWLYVLYFVLTRKPEERHKNNRN